MSDDPKPLSFSLLLKSTITASYPPGTRPPTVVWNLTVFMDQLTLADVTEIFYKTRVSEVYVRMLSLKQCIVLFLSPSLPSNPFSLPPMALSPTRARASSILMRFLDDTHRRITVGRTSLDKWSARRRDLYLTTHNTHNRQTSMPPVGFEPTISAGELSQNYA